MTALQTRPTCQLIGQGSSRGSRGDRHDQPAVKDNTASTTTETTSHTRGAGVQVVPGGGAHVRRTPQQRQAAGHHDQLPEHGGDVPATHRLRPGDQAERQAEGARDRPQDHAAEVEQHARAQEQPVPPEVSARLAQASWAIEDTAKNRPSRKPSVKCEGPMAACTPAAAALLTTARAPEQGRATGRRRTGPVVDARSGARVLVRRPAAARSEVRSSRTRSSCASARRPVRRAAGAGAGAGGAAAGTTPTRPKTMMP